MKLFIVATIALIGVSVCAAGGGPSSQYLPPSFAGAISQPSNQYLAPQASAGGHVHYHGVSGAAHHTAPAQHAPSARSRYGSGVSAGNGGHHGGATIPILRNDFSHDVHSGSYNFGFETANGIRREETSEFIGGWPHGSQSVKGSYSYTGDDGRVYTVNYTADEHGFRAEGDHIPTSGQSHAGGHGGHGHGYAATNVHSHHAGAASGHAPSTQYLPPQQHQQQQQHGGYNYLRHRSH